MATVTLEYATDMILNHSKYEGSEGWKRRVGKMPSWQVMAIYYRMLREGEFNKKVEGSRPKWVQPTLFDFGLKI